MQAPPIELENKPPILETAEPRMPYAWLSLFALFGALILLTTFGYVQQGKKSTESYDEYEVRLKSDLMFRAIGEYLGPSKLSVDSAKIRIPTTVSENRFKDSRAAKLYAASQYELGHKVAPADLSVLTKSNDPADQAFVKIYTSDRLTQDQEQSLIKALPEGPFVNTLAQIHALRKAGVHNAASKVISPSRIKLMMTGYGLIGLGMVSGTLLWILYFALRSNGRLVPLGHPAQPLSRGYAEVFAVRVAQMLTGFITIELLVGVYFRHWFSASFAELIGTLALVLMLPLLALVPIAGKRIVVRSQGWRTEHFGKNVLWGIAAAAANAPLLLLLATVGSKLFSWLPQEAHPVFTQIQSDRSFLTILLVSSAASICAPIFEETMFRGTLLPALSTKLGSVAAGILVSSFFFAAMHPTGPPAWLPLMGIGAVSALLTYQTRSLVPSIVMHSVHNLATLLLALAIT